MALGVGALLAACGTDKWDEQGETLGLKEGEVALQLLPANMGVHQASRGTDVKTAAEQTINNVHVFIFDKGGNYIAANQGDAFQGYRYIEGEQNVVFQSDMFGNGANDATVYVLANIPEDFFHDGNSDGRPDKVGNLEELEKLQFDLPAFTATLPETGLPMVLRQDGVNLSPGATNKIIALQLRSMMARIDLNFTMDPLEGDENYPRLEFSKVTAGNFPKGGKLVSQLVDWNGSTTGKATETADGEGTDIALTTEEVTDAGLVGQILRKGNPQSLTLYMFEHARTVKDGFQYPTDDDDKDKHQRYKNQLVSNGYVKEDAAYVELEGSYVSQNQFRYRVVYRLYVGANPEDDFTIKPNCQYINNITVTGITVNNYGDEALLDTRVTIDKTTPAFIEILRERLHDAHFNVTPMDVYFNNGDASVKIEILNANGKLAGEDEMKWIRMESYHDAPAGLCDYKDEESGYAAQRAGDGKRKYFTTNLLEELEDLHGKTSRFCELNSKNSMEQRVYFYIDENVPQGNSLPEQVPARSATIRITYFENGKEVATRTAIISQAGMWRVYFDKWGTGDNNQRRTAYYFYIEEYEEYLEHYDPKNAYTATYEGLEWGLSGIESGLGVDDGHVIQQYWSWGWYNTAKIMAEYRNASSQWHEMTLNEQPNGAAEYCYNKNKREEGENGTLTDRNVHWFLPTISELEYALEAYYGTFYVFQDKWYWSSNPGANWNPTGGGDSGEEWKKDGGYARATRVKYEPSNPEADTETGYVHYRSNPDYIYVPDGSSQFPGTKGIGGYAQREGVLFRIRAAYIPDSQLDDIWNNRFANSELRNRYNNDGTIR